ncbi:AAA family ATPase [Kineosporia succinea]|uniref:AAA family ATPase n=1 Tax=Kineosporia succinea TaxID=84632 RepID=UPI003F9D7231
MALVAAFASEAELLLLDEPTSGLDPLMENVFRECVQEVRREGRTVLLSSHILSEVEQLCDRVSIVRAGRTVDSGTLDDLSRLTHTTVEAELDAEPTGLPELEGVHGVTFEHGKLHCEVEPDALPEAMRRIAAAGVHSLVSRQPTLEELFLRHYRAASH